MEVNLAIRDKKSGTIIDSFNTLEEAQRELAKHEDGRYEIIITQETLNRIAEQVFGSAQEQNYEELSFKAANGCEITVKVRQDWKE